MGIAEIDRASQVFYIRAKLIFYGDAANDPISKMVANDINDQWNQARAVIQIKGRIYRVQFDISGQFCPGLTPTEVYENTDPLLNYFRVEEFAHGNISFVDGVGSNTGYFKLDNLLNNSSTAAHEFGHTLGLDHPQNLDIRGVAIPGIMYPRGTIVDPHFQYDPAALPASIGGTLNPFHRRVRQEDIDELRLSKLGFDENGKAVVGAFSSVWHDRHLP
jgi:hypothetical protein